MNIAGLENFLAERNQPKFRLGQIRKAVFQDGVSAWSEMTTIPKDLQKLLDENFKILSFDVQNILLARDGRSVKALLKLSDGHLIETVLISPKPDTWSVCVSSQAGCPLGCAFCATGRGGFKRNLTAEEITDQVLFWRQYLKKNFQCSIFNFQTNSNFKNSKLKIDSKFPIQNSKFTLVFMGMGEPFLNWENVRQSLHDLTDPALFGFGSRAISVSTAGIPKGIESLSEEFPQINLAVSLHFATDEERNKFMPINREYNLEKLRDALKKYFQKCHRKVFLEYLLLAGINDSQEDADNLIKYIRSIGHAQLLHVNLIRYNSTSDDLKPSEIGVVREFKDYLAQNGFHATIRKSLGEEIQGACGQLAGK